ncbi:MarR family winged helix-turn-helix transcriptional regulator [Falsirhodobacter sp. 20TX0035]|uniref:MarR family winged helix-turn-helix transcriptional regulator n=1 Tax=Falsirhodobacter sp. 20TX0035 TaxID=3022019 RepID=UPI00232B19E7|nr:MarR family transcriptional regulator [Falsirhodobacter sp. 20TX0035]MDB6453662.1 MarR family transcriptional regulator [Falsirhodobacter sp. 20TX0035]
MTLHALEVIDGTGTATLSSYLETLGLVERMHRLLLDIVKDEFERIGHLDINPIQALLLFNVGANEVTAGELRSRGFYQGSNVSYNLRKLVDLGYMHHERSSVDRRSVRVRLTPRGLEIRQMLLKLFDEHSKVISGRDLLSVNAMEDANNALRKVERFWTEQIRYIY